MNGDKYERTLRQFELYYPNLYERAVDWWGTGRMSIAVKLNNDEVYDYDPMDDSIRQIYLDDDGDESVMRKALGNNIQKLLPFSGMNKSEFAAAVGISTVMLSKYIRGKSSPSAIVLRRIARALGCTTDNLFDDTYTR